MADRQELELIIKAKQQTDAAFAQVMQHLANTGKAAKDTSGSTKLLSAAQGELSGKAEALIGPLGTAGRMLSSIGPAGMIATAAIGATVGVAVYAAKAMADLAMSAGKYAENIQDTADSTMIGTTALQQLNEEFALAGVRFNLEAVITKMNIALEGSPEKFERLGLSVTQLKDDPDNALNAVIKSLQKIESGSERSAAAADIFGRKMASQLLRVDVAAKEAAEQLGLVMGPEQVKAASDFSDQAEQLGRVWAGLWRNLGASIASSPELKKALGDITNAIGDMSRKIQQVGPEITAKLGEMISLYRMMDSLAKGDVRGAGQAWQEGVAANERAKRAAAQRKIDAELALLPKVATGTLGDSALFGIAGPTRAESSRAAQQEAEVKRQVRAMEEAEAAQKRMVETRAKVLKQIEQEVGLIQQANYEQKIYNDSVDELLDLDGYIEDQLRSTGDEAERFLKKQQESVAAAKEKSEGMESFGRTGEKAFKAATKSTFEWSSALSDIANQVKALGGNLMSDIAGGIASAGAQIQSLGKAAKASGGLGNLLTGKGGGGIAGMLTGVSGAMAIGSTALQVGKAVVGALTKSGGEKAAGDLTKMFGGKYTEEQGKAIDDRAKSLGIGRSEAALLDMTNLAGAAGKKMSDVKSLTMDLFAAIGNGAVPATQGVAELKRVFDAMAAEGSLATSPEMVDRLMQSIGDKSITAADGADMLATAFTSFAGAAKDGVAGARKEMLDLIRDTEKAGLKIPEIQASIAEGLSKAAAGIEKLPPIVTAQDAMSQATLFATTWRATMKNSGIFSAIQQMGGGYESLQKQASAGGFDITGAMGGGIGEIMAAAQSETMGPVLQGIDALNAVITGLSDSGAMDPASFAAAQQQAMSAAGQLSAGGMSQAAINQIIGPMLASLQATATDYGMELSPEVQALLASSGLTLAQDKQAIMSDAITGEVVPALWEMVRLQGGVVPALAGMSGVSMGADNPTWAEAIPLDDGGRITKTGGAIVHAGELIGRPDQLAGLGDPETKAFLAELVAVNRALLEQGRPPIQLDGKVLWEQAAMGIRDNVGGLKSAVKEVAG